MAGFIAPRTFYPGDLIHSEEPFARVLSRKMKDVLCEFCCQRSASLKTCTQCSAVKYCSRSCQKKDWPGHQPECKILKNLPESINGDIVRLLGRIIQKIKDIDWKTITTNILGTEVSFDDIDSHYEKMTEHPRTLLQYKEIKEHLRRYIGDGNMPEEDDLIKIIGKVIFHHIHLGLSDGVVVYLSYFLGLSFFDQECIPNSNIQMSDNTLKIRANKKIDKGSEKISIRLDSVLDLDPPLSQCKCTQCSLPYGESVLTKIVDENKAYSVIIRTEEFLERIKHDRTIPISSGTIASAIHLLQDQKGVLGDTNALRLRLLNFKCSRVPGNPTEKRTDFMELEKCMRSAFGDYYLEMAPIYKALMSLNLQLGYVVDSTVYFEKLMSMHMLEILNK